MSKRSVAFPYSVQLTHVVILSGFLLLFFATSVDSRAEAVLYKPANVKQYAVPYHYGIDFSNPGFRFRQRDPSYMKPVSGPGDDIFQIEASDAIDGVKYSQPDVYSLFSSNSGFKVPLPSYVKPNPLQASTQNSSPFNFQDQISPLHDSEKSSLKPARDFRFLDSSVDEQTRLSIEKGDSDYKLKESNLENVLQTHSYEGGTTNVYMQTKNNFTDSGDNLVSVSSDAVLSYDIPSTEYNDSLQNSSVKQSIDTVSDVPSRNSSGFNSSTLLPISKTLQPVHTTPSSVELNTHVYIDYINQTGDENATNSLPSTDSEQKLSSGTVAGIVIAVLVSVTLLSSAVIYLLYRKFTGKCTSVVESKFNTDNCGYLDDSLRSSIYLNNHIELPKESSEEMTSLDNDSFLNSLETMTIQNYWADNSKNTKV